MWSRNQLAALAAIAMALSACQCGKKPPMTSLAKEGEPCQTDEACETGLCDAPPGFSAVCVRKCADVCLAGEVCVQLTPNRFACQPDLRKLCQPCNVDVDCPYPSDKCLSVNTEQVCGRDCAFDQNCPTGYRCVNGVGTDGQPKVQQCVPVNASCACLARGDFQQACQTQNALGTCLGTKQCDLVANAVVCDAPEAVAETCNGRDDDCDGDVDEDQPPTTCGVGLCERTVSACADGGVAVCTPGAPRTETCNTLDDDCDGTADDGFDTMTDVANCGSCGNQCNLPNATSTCSGGACLIDTCATNFANCNGLHPDGCEVNTRTDPAHCGQCNDACVRPNSTATCVNGGCQFVCAAGWIDLNGDTSDGCEYQCTFTSATDLPDLAFTDANCDGLDGEVNNGIFVAPMAAGGSDSNPGTRAAPKLTIGDALATLSTSGKRDVYVAAGTYSGPIDLLGTSGVNVAGAYHPTTWARALSNQVIVQGGNPALQLDGANNVLVQALRLEAANGTASSPSSYGAIIKESQQIRLESLDVRAGNGRAGTSGTQPTPAANGNTGGSGAEGCYDDPRTSPIEIALACNFDLFLDWCGSAPAGASGGTSTCSAAGGSGGAASRYNTPTTANGQPGTQGSPAARGGSAGQGLVPAVTPSPGSVYFGGNGSDGSGGNPGVGAATGTFGQFGYVLSTATAGMGGTAGGGGGGGGGGAGGLGSPLGGIYAGITCYSYGSAGGGGGSGGCGGTGGPAGTSGGASIGLFLFNAQVTAQGVTVRTGNGGAGGNGAAGGSGGSGRAGGSSGYASEQGQATRGGGGGAGGNGGAGGAGGAGAGGPVYGIAKNAASTWSPTGGSVLLGTAGAAGTSPGGGSANGAAGASGVQTTF